MLEAVRALLDDDPPEPTTSDDRYTMSEYEIARALGISQPVVHRTIKRALAKLRRNALARQLWEESNG